MVSKTIIQYHDNGIVYADSIKHLLNTQKV